MGGRGGSFGEKNGVVDAKSHIMSFILTRLSLCRNTGDMSFSFVTIGVVHPVYGISDDNLALLSDMRHAPK